MQPILVVGSIAFDTIHNPSGSYPRILGGSATYASLSASYFATPRLVGVVGKDFPDDAVKMFRDRGVETDGLEVDDGQTFHWEGRYSSDLTSRTSLCTELNVFADFHPKVPAGFKQTPYVMLGNIAPDLQLEVLDQIQSPKLVVADTMNFWIEGALEGLRKVLQRVDLLVINEEEARQLSGLYPVAKVAEAILAMGPRMVVIKQGEYGALLFDGQTVFSAPAYPVQEVRDPTGAGDTFAGGLLGHLAKTDRLDSRTLRQAVIHGSALASFCVEDIGVDRLLTLKAADLAQRYEAFRKLAHFE